MPDLFEHCIVMLKLFFVFNGEIRKIHPYPHCMPCK